MRTLSDALGEVRDGLRVMFGDSLESVLLYGSYARGIGVKLSGNSVQNRPTRRDAPPSPRGGEGFAGLPTKKTRQFYWKCRAFRLPRAAGEVSRSDGGGKPGFSLTRVYARGEQDAESDVDILAVVNLPAETLDGYENAVLDLSFELGLRYDALFSVLLQDAATFRKYNRVMPFFVNVLREGISLV